MPGEAAFRANRGFTAGQQRKQAHREQADRDQNDPQRIARTLGRVSALRTRKQHGSLLGSQYQCQTPKPDQPEADDENFFETDECSLKPGCEIIFADDQGAGTDFEEKEKPEDNSGRIEIPGGRKVEMRSRE